MTGIDDEPCNTEKNLPTPESSKRNVIIAQDELILEMAKELQMLKDELAAVKGQTPKNTPLRGPDASHSLGQMGQSLGQSLNSIDGVANMNTPLNTHNSLKAPVHQSNLPLTQAPSSNNAQSSQTINRPPIYPSHQQHPSYTPHPANTYYQTNTPYPYQTSTYQNETIPQAYTENPSAPLVQVAVSGGQDVPIVHIDDYTNPPYVKFQNGVRRVEKAVDGGEDLEKKVQGWVMSALSKASKGKDKESLEYEDLCVHPGIEYPEGYKVPKFVKFDGKGNPRSHLRRYCETLGVGKNEELRMKLFIHSLEGEALDWYSEQDPSKWINWRSMAHDFMERFGFYAEIPLDRLAIARFKKKTTETFREYAVRWRSEAAKVKPPMSEEEFVGHFIETLDEFYYDRMAFMTNSTFANLVKTGEMYEAGLKSGRITSLAALQATSKAIQSGSGNGFNKKKKEEVGAVVGNIERPPAVKLNFDNSSDFPTYQSPYYPNYPTHYQMPPVPYPVYNAQANYYQPRAHAPNQHPRQPNFQAPQNYQPRPPVRPNVQGFNQNYERRATKTYTPIAESYGQLFERLRNAGVVQPIPDNTPNPRPNWYDANKHCAYHSGAAGHDIERCYTFKDKVEGLIKAGTIQLTGPQPNVHDNPLPNHGNNAVNMISLEEEPNLKGTIVSIYDVKVDNIASKVPKQALTLLPKNEGIFGLGGNPAEGKMEKAESEKKPTSVIPQSLLPLNQSFIQAPEMAMQNLIEGVGSLFLNDGLKCSATIEDFEKEPHVHNAEPSDVMANWTCGPKET